MRSLLLSAVMLLGACSVFDKRIPGSCVSDNECSTGLHCATDDMFRALCVEPDGTWPGYCSDNYPCPTHKDPLQCATTGPYAGHCVLLNGQVPYYETIPTGDGGTGGAGGQGPDAGPGSGGSGGGSLLGSTAGPGSGVAGLRFGAGTGLYVACGRGRATGANGITGAGDGSGAQATSNIAKPTTVTRPCAPETRASNRVIEPG